MQLVDLPTRRDESWRYSDLRMALSDVTMPPDGTRPLQAWNRLDGVVDRLALAQGQHAFTKVQPGEEETLIELVGGDAPFEASVREISVAPGGALTRIMIQTRGNVVLDAAHVSVSDKAVFRQFILAEGAKLARIETNVEIEGEGAEVELQGVYLCNEGRHADLTSIVTHKSPNGKTKQLVKGVARNGGRGVFQGKIVVERGAQKTDARQYHHGMLLEEGAEIFAKPELMIHADDVACAHGNTAGGLDETALFYLRSRGVRETEARALLTEAFLFEALPEWLPPNMRGELEARVGAWLRGAR
ncbi:MAG: SufD family Fe-S cluster assembly protein [Terricaulis sp.]